MSFDGSFSEHPVNRLNAEGAPDFVTAEADRIEDILRSMKPSKNMIDIAMSMLKDAWDQRGDQAKQAKAEIRRQHNALDKQQDALVERMIETSNPKVMAALESKIAKLEEDKLLLTDKLSQSTKPKRTLGEIIELFKDFLPTPWNIYDNGSLEVRKTIIKTAFKAPLAYDRQNGHRTPQVSVIFEFLRISHQNVKWCGWWESNPHVLADNRV